MPIFLVLFAVPLLEIATFIVVGGAIGVLPTLLITLVTAVLGTILLRRQGVAILNRIRTDLESDRIPAKPIVEGAMIAIAGVLLLTPGFVTDTIGFALFVPQIRHAFWLYAAKRIDIRTPAGFRNSSADAGRMGDSKEPIIDLNDSDYVSRPNPDSPWKDNP